MSRLSYKDLLARVSERLSATGVETDYLLLTRWRVLGLAQYLAGKPAGDAEKLSVEALSLFIREGPGKLADDAIQNARKAVATATSTNSLSVLPTITSEVRKKVLSRLQKFKTLGNTATEQAIDMLPALRERLRKSPSGALLSGLLHRVELVAAIVENHSRSDEQRIHAASAILYLNEIHDAIPDTLDYIGLLDDDFALRVVLDELSEHTEDEKLHWAERILRNLGRPAVPAGSSSEKRWEINTNHMARPHKLPCVVFACTTWTGNPSCIGSTVDRMFTLAYDGVTYRPF